MNSANAGLLAGFIISVLQASGYLGVLGLMAIESACLPLPSEIILPFAGYLVSTGRLNLYLVATVGALGCNLGSAIAYAMGAYGGRPAVRRWGKYVLLTDDDLNKAEWFFQRFGGPAVFIGRMLPVIRTFIALPAGIAHMPVIRFHLYTFAGSWPWCFLLAWVGMKLGDKWGSNGNLHAVFHYFDYAVVVIAVVVVGRFVWSRWGVERPSP
jgi:membrane protein DedA with SNARE-associated domain